MIYLFIVLFLLQYFSPFPVFRPKWMTEVRRDGKDDAVIENLIRTEFDRRLALPKRKKSKFIRRYIILPMRIFLVNTSVSHKNKFKTTFFLE